MRVGRVALVLGALLVMAWPAVAQTPQAASQPQTWQPSKADFEAAVATAVKQALDSPDAVSRRNAETQAAVRAATPSVVSTEAAFEQAVQRAYVQGSMELNKKRFAMLVMPTPQCNEYKIEVFTDGKAPRPNEIEYAVTQNLSCCLQNTLRDDKMACIHRNVQWLVWSHTKQAREGQQWFFWESAIAAGGAAGGAIDALNKVSKSTASVWAVIAFAPVIVEELGGAGPRSQVHYAAGHAFGRLASHYRMLDRSFGLMPGSVAETAEENLSLQCRLADKLEDVGDKSADATVFNTEIAKFKTYCSDYLTGLRGVRSYRTSILVAHEELPELYANDAQAMEGVFHKMSFKLQAPPSKALQTAFAAPFASIASALKDGKTIEEYKTELATFQLEKDGLPLSGVWPAQALPTALPLASVKRTSGGKAAQAKLVAAGGATAQTVAETVAVLNAVESASADADLIAAHDKTNRMVAATADRVGTYKMVFDLRAEKRTADIEFTRLADKK